MATLAPTMVQPGLNMSEPYVFTAFPNVAHLRAPHQVDRTRCDQPVRYYAKPGDTRSWPLCHICEHDKEMMRHER